MSTQGQCPSCNQPNDYTKVVCDFCGSRLPWATAVQRPAVTPPVAVDPAPESQFLSYTPLRTGGAIFLTLGLFGLLYFGLLFDTSVSVGAWGRVNNIGLMAQRSNGLMLSGGAFALGIILYAMDYMKGKS